MSMHGSSIKTILIPIEDHDAMLAALEAARLVAVTFDSYIEGIAVRPSVQTYISVDPMINFQFFGATEGDAAGQARERFESFMRSHGIPLAKQEHANNSYAWPRAETMDDDFIGSYGRTFDLIVLGRPGRAPQNPRIRPLEAALFDSGRPVLIVPPFPPKTIARRILVSWNGSTEQVRAKAFAFALPFLHLADTVTVLTVEDGTTRGPACESAVLHLRRNGIKANALTVKPETHNSGGVILDTARALNCDLLVNGAYTQSRWRRMIFGGAACHILANATLPVLMVN